LKIVENAWEFFVIQNRSCDMRFSAKCLKLLVAEEGFEPPTHGL
jgi:hypothetical protein